MFEHLRSAATPAAIAIASAAALLILRHIAFRYLVRLAAKTASALDDAALAIFRAPSAYWCVAIGIYIGIALSSMPEKHVLYLGKCIHIIVLFSITVAVANLSVMLLDGYLKKTDLPSPSGITHGVMKTIVFIIGGLIALNILGISITPILTALGVGGLAVALALQDTLSNLFSGIHILIEKSVRAGDFVRLESGQEGYVEDITWRTTRIRMLPNNMVIIPNSKLAQSIVVNYFLPEKRMSLLINVGVDYSSDPDHVERILIDEATKAAGDIQGLLADPAPAVRFIPGFGDSSLDFTLICQVAEFVDQYLIQSELRKRILKRFRKEGIGIPFPHRTVIIEK